MMLSYYIHSDLRHSSITYMTLGQLFNFLKPHVSQANLIVILKGLNKIMYVKYATYCLMHKNFSTNDNNCYFSSSIWGQHSSLFSSSDSFLYFSFYFLIIWKGYKREEVKMYVLVSNLERETLTIHFEHINLEFINYCFNHMPSVLTKLYLRNWNQVPHILYMLFSTVLGIPLGI